MGKAYRTIQPSRYEGRVTREAVATAVRSLSENNNGVRIKAVAGSNLAQSKERSHATATTKKS